MTTTFKTLFVRLSFLCRHPAPTRRAARARGSSLLLAAWLFVASSAAAQTSPPAGFGMVELLSPLRPVFTVAPGGKLQSDIVLVNHGDVPASVKLSQEDYRSDAQGAAQYAEPGTSARSNAAWVTLGRNEVQIAPGEQVTVPYYLSVPNDTALVGSYWSLIVVEPKDATTVQSAQGVGGEVKTSVRVNFRYGVSVLTNLGDSGQSGLSFSEPVFTQPEDGSDYLLQVKLHNVGERLLEPEVWLELVDEKGTQLGRFESGEPRVFPDGVVQAQFSLGTLPPGDYQALVIADAGSERVFGVRYTLNVEVPRP